MSALFSQEEIADWTKLFPIRSSDPYGDANKVTIAILQTLDTQLESTLPVVASVKEIAAKSKGFDFVLTTGKSRVLSTTLLQAANVPPNKIVEFACKINNHAYKFDGSHGPIQLHERAPLLLDELARLGVDLSRRPSVIIVDEYVKSGAKMQSYLKIFRGNTHLSQVNFAAIVSQISPSNPYFYSPIVPKSRFDPLELSYTLIKALADIISAQSPEEPRFREPFLGQVKEFSRIALSRLEDIVRKS